MKNKKKETELALFLFLYKFYIRVGYLLIIQYGHSLLK